MRSNILKLKYSNLSKVLYIQYEYIEEIWCRKKSRKSCKKKIYSEIDRGLTICRHKHNENYM